MDVNDISMCSVNACRKEAFAYAIAGLFSLMSGIIPAFCIATDNGPVAHLHCGCNVLFQAMSKLKLLVQAMSQLCNYEVS